MIHGFHSAIASNSLVVNQREFNDIVAARIPWDTLTNVTSIDLRNCSLTSIPIGIGRFDPGVLTTLRLEGNPLLGFHRSLVESRASVKDIILNIRESLDGKVVEFKELKVMVVGEPAVGKTSMVKVLSGRNPRELASRPCLATDGIDLGEIHLDGYRLMFWDFAGQEVYRYTHQLFLSDNSLCLIVYRVTTVDEEALRQVTYWMDSVLQRAPNAVCLLIGTHARSFPDDVAETRLTRLTSLAKERFGEKVCGCVAVDSLNGFGFHNLRDALIQIAMAKVKRERKREGERESEGEGEGEGAGVRSVIL